MTAAAKSAFSPKHRVSTKKIPVPDYLVRETIDGERWFYRGQEKSGFLTTGIGMLNCGTA
jgi:hypothetical protein